MCVINLMEYKGRGLDAEVERHSTYQSFFVVFAFVHHKNKLEERRKTAGVGIFYRGLPAGIYRTLLVTYLTPSARSYQKLTSLY